MKLEKYSPLAIYQILTAMFAIIIPVIGGIQLDLAIENILGGLLGALIIALLVNFPIVLLGREVLLVHLLSLGMGLLFGGPASILSLTAGIILGSVVSRPHPPKIVFRLTKPVASWLEILSEIGSQSIPIAITFLLPGWITGNTSGINLTDQPGIIIAILLFTVVHTALFLLNSWLQSSKEQKFSTREIVSPVLTIILPLPFVFLTVLAYPSIRLGSLVMLGGIIGIIVVLMDRLSIARYALDRRLQDLSTIDNVSKTLRSTLNLENLLEAIHTQVTHLMGVNSFYVALFEPTTKQIWYPLAVKHGERQQWPRRDLMDRLTDRVILESKPIILPRHAQNEIARIGLPPGEESLSAWLGVPLITSDNTIGCLAVLSISPDMEFTEADLNLLTILSGQASVAIENALLFDQAQNRAAQLENLNQISTLIVASLDLNQVLRQVCQSVIQVGGGKKSAIFLLYQDEGEIRLAHSQGLSETFVEENRTFSAAHNVRARCLRTGKPELTQNILEIQNIDEYQQSLKTENICAFGDFPLITPEGQIGFLTVYFDTPQTFPDEQVELLQTFASQAALAVSNASLHSYTDKALTQRAHQLSILEAVGREIAATTYSDNLFRMVLDYALDFTNSPWGSLVLYDPNKNSIEIKASKGYKLKQSNLPDNYGITSRVIHTQKPALIADTSRDPDYVDLTAGMAKSQLSVPLIYESRVLGVITLESSRINAFDSNDQAFISQLANQASVAVVNAELYQETQRRLREQASLYLVSSRLVGNLELESVAHTVGQAIGAAIEATLTGVYLWDAYKDAYTLRTQIQNSYLETHKPLPSQLSGGQLRSNYPSMQYTDTLRIYQTKEQLLSHLNICDFCQALILPLTFTGEHFGIVVLHIPKEQTFTADEMQLPRAIAAQGSIAIQNALLFKDVTEGRDRLEAVLNSVGEGVMMVDSQGYITLVNAPIENLTNTPAGKLIRTRLLSLSEPALRTLGLTHNKAEDLLKTLAKGHAPPIYKTTVNIKEPGHEKVFECTSAPVWGYGERVIGLIIVVRDVTEEYEINQARELITQTIVHDLKSPMSAIVSALALIDEVTNELPAQDEIIDQSISIGTRAAHRVLALVEALLDIAQMESGKMGLKMETVNLSDLINQVSKDFMPQARSIGVVLRVNADSNLPFVRADIDKITRVLTNLLDNALKFSPTGGQIIISAMMQGLMANVQVTDNGPGIEEEYREKIFERFSQVPGVQGRKRGSGIGLTFCRLVVEAHHGQIWVEPNPGGGSIFRFTLPITGKQE